MIGYIQGKVLSCDGKKALILTSNGIGYDINYGYFLHTDKTTSEELGLYIHHHISENDQSLWGFNNIEDKKMFELLKTVNKVGSSKAYPLITNIGTKALIDAIMFEQAAVLTKAPGIGKKMSEQIILSLKDKVEKFSSSTLQYEPKVPNSVQSGQSEETSIDQVDKKLLQETLMALESLGYKDKASTGSMMKILQSNKATGSITTSEDLLKRVLKEL